MQNLKLCKLTGGQFMRTRELYEEVFDSDSKAFVDYYYEVKTKRSIALILENVQGEIVSMLHLNPYQLKVRTERGLEPVSAYYIVAVATKKEYRHRGCMRRLLLEAEKVCEQNQVPFLFLMPADSAIYTPFGYTYRYSRPVFRFTGSKLPSAVKMVCLGEELSSEHWEALAVGTNRILEQQYDFFVERDKEYYVNLYKEVKAQNGEMGLFYFDEQPLGYYAKTGEEPNLFCGQDGIGEALISEQFLELCKHEGLEIPITISKERYPIIMGKVLPFATKWEAWISPERRGCLNELV